LKGIEDPTRAISSNLEQRDQTTLDAGLNSLIHAQGSFNVNVTKHSSYGPASMMKKMHNNRDLLISKEEQRLSAALTQRPLNSKEEAYIANLRPMDVCVI
jgi:hypothetical protein